MLPSAGVVLAHRQLGSGSKTTDKCWPTSVATSQDGSRCYVCQYQVRKYGYGAACGWSIYLLCMQKFCSSEWYLNCFCAVPQDDCVEAHRLPCLSPLSQPVKIGDAPDGSELGEPEGLVCAHGRLFIAW